MYDKPQFEAQILEFLNAGKKVSVKWNCGGDEAIVTLFLDDKEVPWNDKFAREFDLYLVNYLNLPDVGEFSMDGVGNIIEENDKLYIEYESITRGYESYSKDYESSEWKEVNEVDPMFSGKKRLF